MLPVMNIKQLLSIAAPIGICIFGQTASALSPGDVAPNFSAKNQNGKEIHLSDFKGQYVLIYFYPKDETPGCTKQACDLRDRHEQIKKLNTVVLGVSRQGADSHKQFIEKHKLPFDLLVDSDGSVGKALGVGSMPIIGFSDRSSLLIGPDGKVIHFYKDVDAAKHADTVLEDLKKAQAAPKSKA
jgi:thioredoxin-dependent peroxiredoxin